MTQQLQKEHLEALQESIAHPAPFCSGILPVTSNDLFLYYGKDENFLRLNLFRPSSESLERLAKACDPATFGKNHEDTYDESYRRAGKLSTDAYVIGLDIVNSQLLKVIRTNLLRGLPAQKPIRAELYNLNVYGEGSFFKAHRDTPRGTRMFGSLVVFFPTSYEGGALVMRQKGEEWTFDAAKALEKCGSPHIGYVALYSDVEHEVSLVTSGYRVTVTYNLYFDEDSPSSVIPSSLSHNTITFKKELERLLLDPAFLPGGGCLGFNLEHHYPVEASSSAYVNLKEIENCLKGVDAEMMQVAKELSLHASVRGLVSCDGLFAFEKKIPDYTSRGYDEDNSLMEHLHEVGGVILENVDYYETERDIYVNWVTELSELNRNEKPYAYYGNAPEVDFAYNSFCLFIEVGKPEKRTRRPKLRSPDEPQDERDDDGDDSENDDEDEDDNDNDNDDDDDDEDDDEGDDD